jgi:hypothetical protein
VQLPKPAFGIDVVSPEGTLAGGTVRRAENVVLSTDGQVRRRYGEGTPLVALTGMHSLWRSPVQQRLLCAAGSDLYEIRDNVATSIFTGLEVGRQVSFCDAAGDIMFASGSVIGKITASGLIRRPGVADLMGTRPRLQSTVGALPPGRYGVAFSLSNDLGEESGLSGIEWIDLPSGGGILVDRFTAATNSITLNVYVTAANGGELALYQSLGWTAAVSIGDSRRSRPATRHGRAPLPGGDIVRFFHGRTYVATANWLYYSDPFDRGVYDIKSGWVQFDRRITVLQPVDGGIFVGTRNGVYFLRGNDPVTFEQVQVSVRPPIPHSGAELPGSFFNPQLVPEDRPVAAWLSDVGVMVGKSDGSVVALQSDRVRLSATAATLAAVLNGGMKQVIFCVESMAMGVGGPSTVPSRRNDERQGSLEA